jgi:hypothetical protein
MCNVWIASDDFLGTMHWKINWSGFESAEAAGSAMGISLERRPEGQVALGVDLE